MSIRVWLAKSLCVSALLCVCGAIAIWHFGVATRAKAQNLPLSDQQILANIFANLIDGPNEAIGKVRTGAAHPMSAPTLYRLGVCVGRYANDLARQVRSQSAYETEVDLRICPRFGTCNPKAKQELQKWSVGADLLAVVAEEMQGQQVAEKRSTFQDWVKQVVYMTQLYGWALKDVATLQGHFQSYAVLETCK